MTRTTQIPPMMAVPYGKLSMHAPQGPSNIPTNKEVWESVIATLLQDGTGSRLVTYLLETANLPECLEALLSVDSITYNWLGSLPTILNGVDQQCTLLEALEYAARNGHTMDELAAIIKEMNNVEA